MPTLPEGFEGFDTPTPPDERSALKKQFESARKGQPFRLGSAQYEVRVGHGYVSGVPGMPRGSRGYMVLVFDSKLSLQERAADKGGGTTTLVLDIATDKVYVYPWATTRTDSRGVPKGKPVKVIGAGKGDWPDPMGRPSLDSLQYRPGRTHKLAEDLAVLEKLAQWKMQHGDKTVALQLRQLKRAVETGQAKKAKPLYDKLAATGLVPRRVIDLIHASRGNVEMNARQEKDIIRTLVKAGRETLAKSFARSRGYRVRAGRFGPGTLRSGVASDPSDL